MDIKYFGDSSFLIKSKGAAVITDPFSSQKSGLKFPKTEAQIVTFSEGKVNSEALERVDGNPLVINMAGEYERQGIRVQGYLIKNSPSEKPDSVIYKIEAEGLSVLHCGSLSSALSQELIEDIDVVDILMISAENVGEFTTKKAVEVVRKIEPSIVIPMHFIDASEFLSQMDVSSVEPVKKLSVKVSDMSEDTKVVVLEKV